MDFGMIRQMGYHMCKVNERITHQFVWWPIRNLCARWRKNTSLSISSFG